MSDNSIEQEESMTTLDLDALERAARAATERYGPTNSMLSALKDEAAEYEAMGAKGLSAIFENAASHLELFPPSTILSLISDYRALQERVEGAEKALRPFADAYDKHKNHSTTEMGFSATHKAFEEARAYFATPQPPAVKSSVVDASEARIKELEKHNNELRNCIYRYETWWL